MKACIALLIFCISVVCLNAQPELTSGKLPKPGTVFYSKKATVRNLPDYKGLNGQTVSINLPNFPVDSARFTYLSPGALIESSLFPDADIVLERFTQTTYQGTVYTDTFYLFKRLAEGGLYNLGACYPKGLSPVSNNLLEIPLPLTLGLSLNQTELDTFIVYTYGSGNVKTDSNRYEQIITRKFNVPGWLKLVVAGNTFDVLALEREVLVSRKIYRIKPGTSSWEFNKDENFSDLNIDFINDVLGMPVLSAKREYAGEFGNELEYNINYLVGEYPLSSNSPEPVFKSLVYPNPSDGMIQIEKPGLSSLRYTFFDLAGKLVLDGITADGRVNADSLLPGCYMLQIVSDNKSAPEVHRIQLSR